MPTKVLEGDGRTTRLKESDRDYQMMVALNARAIAPVGIADVPGLQDELNLKAPLDSPALTGVPTAPTAPPGTDTTQIATTAFVTDAVDEAVSLATAWTPTFNCATPGDLSVTYSVQTARYIKISSLVTLWVRMTFMPTFTTATGNITIQGLPFTASGAIDHNVGTMHFQAIGNTASPTYPTGCTTIVPMLQAAAASIQIAPMGSGFTGANNPTWLTMANLTSGRSYRMSIQLNYIAAGGALDFARPAPEI